MKKIIFTTLVLSLSLVIIDIAYCENISDNPTIELNKKISSKKYLKVNNEYTLKSKKLNIINTENKNKLENDNFKQKNKIFKEEDNINYEVSCLVGWMPTKVYNDNGNTIIQFPEKILDDEKKPVPLVIRKNIDDLSTFNSQKIDFYIDGNLMIINEIIDKVILIVGSGSKKEQVIITRG